MNPRGDRLSFACDAARAAGQLALDYFNDLASLTIRSKGVQDMASEADIASEKLIRDRVSSAYPDDLFLGEEGSESFRYESGKGTWIVDPIDGTQPFVNGIRSWCISIAYYELGRVRVGVVYDPTTGELFSARAGNGATLNGEPVRASAATSLLDGLVSVGFSNRVSPEDTLGPLERLMRAQGMYHRNGSGALSLAYVAAGRLIGYFEPHMNSWDFAAGSLLVNEAGGRTNDCLPTPKTLVDGGPIVAAADGVFDRLMEVVEGS